jgi:hypothetical protein
MNLIVSKIMNILDTILAYGHPLVKCSHKTTIELTKEGYLTEKGSCILGIKASKACKDLSAELKEKIRNGDTIRVLIEVDDIVEAFIGYGDEKLNLKSKKDMVFRKSSYICDRTVLINCTKSSMDLNRELIKKLNDPNKRFAIKFQELRRVED